MRIPLNLPRSHPIASGQPAADAPTGRCAAPATATPGVRVSLSRNGLDASRGAVARERTPGMEPGYRPERQRQHGTALPAGGPRQAPAPACEPTGAILRLQRRLLQEYPVLRDEARAAIESRLLQDHGLHLDADHTYFNVFHGGHSSRDTYNGWQHDSAPVMSLSLTDIQMRNFPADLGQDPNGLNANSGVYTEGSNGSAFGTVNEVRLLSSELKRAVRANDVGASYHDKLGTWWKHNEANVATLYQAQVRKWRRDGEFSPEARAMLRDVLQVADGKKVQGKVQAHVFDINSYPSNDMTWLRGAGGRVILIMPGSARPLREYASVEAMRGGIEGMVRTASGRKELASHFSLYNRKDGTTYQGVEKWLGDIAGGGYGNRIAYQPRRIEGNIFRDQAARTRAGELDDIKRQVKSSGEVSEEESTQFVRVLGQLFPEVFLPAKATELALDVHQAVTDGAAEDRRRAAHDALVAGIELAVTTALGALATPIRRVAGPGAVERAAYFNAPARASGGRIGYLLGPIEAPRLPDTFGEVLDEANETVIMPGGWDDDDFTLSSASDSDSGDGLGALDYSSSSPSPSPHQGWWAPGQEVELGAAPSPLAPPPSPVTPLPGFGAAGNAEGLPYINELGWIERRDIAHVYRVERVEALASRSPELQGFEPDMVMVGNSISIADRYLFTIESEQGALEFGTTTYGAGNFAVFRIDANGVPAMPYRLNINYDMWGTMPPVVQAQATGQPLTPDIEWLSSYVHGTPESPGEIPAGFEILNPDDQGSYERGNVFVDNQAITPDRIHRTH